MTTIEDQSGKKELTLNPGIRWRPPGPVALSLAGRTQWSLEDLRDEWLPLFSAISDYVRLSDDLEHFDRTAAMDKIQDSLAQHDPAADDDIDWANLRGPRTAKGYYPDFHQLGNRLLAARDALLIDVRSARLAGFSHHILDF